MKKAFNTLVRKVFQKEHFYKKERGIEYREEFYTTQQDRAMFGGVSCYYDTEHIACNYIPCCIVLTIKTFLVRMRTLVNL